MNVPWNRTFRELFRMQNIITSFSRAFFNLGCVLNTWSTWDIFILQFLSIIILPGIIVPIAYVGIKGGRGGYDEFLATIVLLLYLMYPPSLRISPS